MNSRKSKFQLGIDAIIAAVCFALAPVQGGLDLGGVSLNKYISLATMIVVILFGLLARKRDFDETLIHSLLPFAFICLVSVVWATNKSVAYRELVSFFSYFAYFIILASRAWYYYEKQLFKAVILASNVYYSFLLIAEMIDGSTRASISFTEAGTVADQNTLAVNLVIGFVIAIDFFANLKNLLLRIALLVSSVMIFVGIITTGSRGAFLSLIVSTIFYLFKSNKVSKKVQINVLVVGIALIVTFYILIDNEKSFLNQMIISRYTDLAGIEETSGRFEIWQSYIRGLFKMPLYLIVGAGVGCHLNVLRQVTSASYATHNDLIYLLCSFGIIGTFLFMNFVKYLWKNAKIKGDILSLTCFVGIFMGCMDVNLIATTGFWNVMIILSMCIGVNDDEQIEKTA